MKSGQPVPDIKDLPYQQLSEWLAREGMQPYRTVQILKWIYQRQADSFEVMTDLSKPLRLKLASVFRIDRLRRLEVQTSCDGTRKYLFELPDGQCIESVLIPERDHHTLCLSSQVGCAQGCRFCLTARAGFVRNLSLGEIVAQVRDIFLDYGTRTPLTNIVFMGMGEPLANYRHLIGAIEVLTDTRYGFGFANRRITVSTAGIVPRLVDLGNDTAVNLAISLNATEDDTREWLMPINRRFPIQTLLAGCRQYRLRPHRRITFEYILIKDVNDTEADARRLAKLLRPVRAKVNLIPFNEHPGCPFQRPSEDTVRQFQAVLIQNHYTAIIRRSKGQDILAACGQLRGSKER